MLDDWEPGGGQLLATLPPMPDDWEPIDSSLDWENDEHVLSEAAAASAVTHSTEAAAPESTAALQAQAEASSAEVPALMTALAGTTSTNSGTTMAVPMVQQQTDASARGTSEAQLLSFSVASSSAARPAAATTATETNTAAAAAAAVVTEVPALRREQLAKAEADEARRKHDVLQKLTHARMAKDSMPPTQQQAAAASSAGDTELSLTRGDPANRSLRGLIRELRLNPDDPDLNHYVRHAAIVSVQEAARRLLCRRAARVARLRFGGSERSISSGSVLSGGSQRLLGASSSQRLSCAAFRPTQ